MTTRGIGRDFGAGLSANILDVTLVVNINQDLFTYRFIRMNYLTPALGVVRMEWKDGSDVVVVRPEVRAPDPSPSSSWAGSGDGSVWESMLGFEEIGIGPSVRHFCPVAS
jgi:hypothetical protein